MNTMTLNIGGLLSSGNAGLQPLSVAGHVAFEAASSGVGTPHAHPSLGLVGLGRIGAPAGAARSSSRVEMRPTAGASGSQVGSSGAGPNYVAAQMLQRRFSAGGSGFGHSLQQLLVDPSTSAVAASSSGAVWDNHFGKNRSHLMPPMLVGRGAPRSGSETAHVVRTRDAENVDNLGPKAELQRSYLNSTGNGGLNQPLSSRNSVLNKPFDNRE